MVAMETPSVPAAAPARSRILLVEDQTSIREMLSDVLARMDEFEVVGQAADVPEALRLARETQPDVVVLDWLFPNGTGLDFLRELRPSRLQCRVLVLTGNTNDESVGDALAFGARGFFEKVGGAAGLHSGRAGRGVRRRVFRTRGVGDRRPVGQGQGREGDAHRGVPGPGERRTSSGLRFHAPVQLRAGLSPAPSPFSSVTSVQPHCPYLP